jgi:hypothetical protein
MDKTCNCMDPVPEDPFETELQALLEKYNKETDSSTPVFVLTSYLVMCLKNFNYCTRYRDNAKEAAA